MVVIAREMRQIEVAPKHVAIQVQRKDGRLPLGGDKRHHYGIANERRIADRAAEIPLITVDDNCSSDRDLQVEPVYGGPGPGLGDRRICVADRSRTVVVQRTVPVYVSRAAKRLRLV